MSFSLNNNKKTETFSEKTTTTKTHRNGLPRVLHPDPTHQQQVRQGPTPVQGVGRQQEVEGEEDDVELDLKRKVFLIFFRRKLRSRGSKESEFSSSSSFLLLPFFFSCLSPPPTNFLLTANVTSASHTLFEGGHTLHLTRGCPTPAAAKLATSTDSHRASCGRCVRGPATATQRSLEGDEEWPTKARPPKGHRRIPLVCVVVWKKRKERGKG